MKDEFDAIVIGAGTAGLGFAVSAAEQGLRTAVVEQARSIGGTLHRTGGMMSAAGTRRQRQAGIEDDIELHLKEVLRVARQGYDAELVEAAVKAAPQTVDWLDEYGFRFHEDAPAIYYGHEPYSVPRTYWGEAAGESILEALKVPWEGFTTSGILTPFLSHSLGDLVVDNGRVLGVEIASIETGRLKTIRAPHVVLATGGFGSNAEMYRSYSGRETQPPSASMPGNRGVGHRVATASGAAMHQSKEILRLGRFPKPGDPTRVDLSIRADFEALGRPPREIWVNRHGKRFIDETEPVNTVQEHALLEQPEQTFWAVFDSRTLASGQSLVRGWDVKDYHMEADLDRREIWKADSIGALARAADIDEEGLVATVEDWNEGARSRGYWNGGTPMRIDTAPFFALRCRGAILTTFSGLVADDRTRVVSEAGAPIPGLFAIGEVIGAAAVNGEAWVGGMCVTPAISLGRTLAKSLAASGSR